MRCAVDESLEFFFGNSDFITSLSISFTNNFCCAYLKATIRLRKISIKITVSGESPFGLKVSEGCDLDHTLFGMPSSSEV
jgi:hypothetical protein